MSQWKHLTQQALLGTERTLSVRPTNPAPASALSQALDQVCDSADAPARQLLLQAGIIGHHHQLAQRPARRPNSSSTGSAEHIAFSRDLACQINIMFNGRYKELLNDVLAQIAAANLMVPNRVVPNLLEHGATNRHARQWIFNVITTEARQLAAQHPKWIYASPDVFTWDGARRVWDATKTSLHTALVIQLRYGKPALARELVEHVWNDEPAHYRHNLLRTFEINLSMADEPTLERMLNDRQLQVRREAARLLSHLPESRFAKRARNYTLTMLRWHASQRRLALYTPHTISAVMQRDGTPTIRGKKSEAKLKGEQLVHLISAVPLAVHERRLGLQPQQITQAAFNSRWPRTLIEAFTLAALRQQNVEWAIALLNTNITPKTAPLINLLDDAQRLVIFERAAHYGLNLTQRDNSIVRLYSALTEPWGAEISLRWLDALENHLPEDKSRVTNTAIASITRRFGRFCPPEYADQVAERLLPRLAADAWTPRIHHLIDQLRFRYDIEHTIRTLQQRDQ